MPFIGCDSYKYLSDNSILLTRNGIGSAKAFNDSGVIDENNEFYPIVSNQKQKYPYYVILNKDEAENVIRFFEGKETNIKEKRKEKVNNFLENKDSKEESIGEQQDLFDGKGGLGYESLRKNWYKF